MRLDALCRIPISRFYRDWSVFDAVGRQCLPEAAAMASARGDDAVRCWSAGCASGEEPYTLVLAWRFRVANDWPRLGYTVLATDADETMIERAEAACYGQSSLKDVPRSWCERAFTRRGQLCCLDAEFRGSVDFRLQDIRQAMPDDPFDVVLCRNLVFTYFDEGLQSRVLERLRERIRPGGFLVLGGHEALLAASIGLVPIAPNLPISRREMQTLRGS
ncbi:MAG TPA: CheR family methyltransferase [Stellaceae bacterium]|nr:CheR family methyltransferase [Stellaceae bacterium]